MDIRNIDSAYNVGQQVKTWDHFGEFCVKGHITEREFFMNCGVLYTIKLEDGSEIDRYHDQVLLLGSSNYPAMLDGCLFWKMENVVISGAFNVPCGEKIPQPQPGKAWFIMKGKAIQISVS